jgi:hypothetical protein
VWKVWVSTPSPAPQLLLFSISPAFWRDLLSSMFTLHYTCIKSVTPWNGGHKIRFYLQLEIAICIYILFS